MSMTFYCYKEDHIMPVGSHGPLDETEDMYHFEGSPRTLDPTIEQEIEAGWFNGPNLSNTNADMVLRSLGYGYSDGATSFDPAEMLGRVTMARACPPVDDTGMPDIRHGNVVSCGVRPGYFDDRYSGIAEVCEQAIEWGVQVICA